MPNYTFRNKKTNEEFILTLSLKEREDYLEKNPNIEQIINTPPAIGDPVRLGVTKVTNSAFNDRLRQIKKAHRGSTINAPNITEI